VLLECRDFDAPSDVPLAWTDEEGRLTRSKGQSRPWKGTPIKDKDWG
jgi:hypothetical protein